MIEPTYRIAEVLERFPHPISVIRGIRHPIVAIATISLLGCGGGLPFPGLSVEEVYNLGVGALEEENWKEATRAFEEVLVSTGFDRMPEAGLQLAESHFGGARYIAARTEFQRVMEASFSIATHLMREGAVPASCIRISYKVAFGFRSRWQRIRFQKSGITDNALQTVAHNG